MSSILKFISFVILAFFLYLVFKGCSFNIGGSKLAPIISVTNNFFGQLKNKDYSGIYSSLGPEWRNKQTLQSFISFMKDLENTLGLYETGIQKNINIQPTPNGEMAIVYHAGVFSKSKNCLVTITLGKQINDWLILGINFNAPELNKSQVCPKCSQKLNMSAKFCPKCGADLNAPVSKDPLINQDEKTKKIEDSGTK